MPIYGEGFFIIKYFNNMFDGLTTFELVMLALAGVLVGAGKAGIVGTGMVAVPVFATILGGRTSTGFLLPLLFLCDTVAIIYYGRKCRWDYLLRLSVWVLIGIFGTAFVGKIVSESTFDVLLASAIMVGVVLMILKEYNRIPEIFFRNRFFTILIGIVAGFAAMIGNAAGTIMSIFLLAMAVPKDEFIGTRSTFFFLINAIKFPFHIFLWHTITMQTLIDDLKLLPFILIGLIGGIFLVKRINEKFFRKMVFVLVIISGLILFFK